MKDSLLNGNKRLKFGEDLLLRWRRADAVKKDKIPLIPHDSRYAITDITIQQYYSYVGRELFYPYEFSTLDGSGTWDLDSPNANIEYGKWYDYFEGTAPDSGGGGDVSIATSMTLHTLYAGSWCGFATNSNPTYNSAGYVNGSNASSNLVAWGESRDEGVPLAPSDITVQFSQSQVDRINAWLTDNNLVPVVVLGNDVGTSSPKPYNNYYLMIYGVDDMSNVVLGENTSFETYGYRYVSTSRIQRIYVGRLMVVNGVVDVTNASIDYNPSTFGGPTNLKGSVCMAAYSIDSGGGGGGGDAEPVYPPIPTPETPTQPNVTIVNSPTYVQPTYITQSIDIDKLNQNMIAGFSSIAELINGWDSAIKQTLENWESLWVDYTSALYEDLTMYLNDIFRVLIQIRSLLGNSPTVNPTIGEGLTNQQQAMVNIDLLRRKFPFSIPWDVYAVLAYLEAPPTSWG